MRREPTPAEWRMWRLLRNRRLAGFRRMHPVGLDIANFYCAVAHMIVEFDGDSHIGNEEADKRHQEDMRDSPSALFASGTSILPTTLKEFSIP